MNRSISSPLEAQIRRVRRRLFIQRLVNSSIWCLAAALALGAAWYWVQPYVLPAVALWVRWAVAGGLMAAAGGLAFGLAFWRLPSQLMAAMYLDERFGLKERAVTSYTLEPQQRTTPAGEAMLADAEQRVAGLNVGSRFPVRLSWTAAVVPLCAGLLVAVAVFTKPPKTQAGTEAPGNGERTGAGKEDAAEQNKKIMAELRPPADKNGDKKPQSEELESIDDQMEKIALSPYKTEAERQARADELAKVEEEIKKTKEERAEKDKAVQEELQKDPEELQKLPKDGPAKEFQDALAKGDNEKAQEELEKLTKDLKNDKLSEEEKQKLENQLEELQKQLKKDAERAGQKKDEFDKQLADQKKKEEELQKQQEQLQKEKKDAADKGDKDAQKQAEKAEQELQKKQADAQQQSAKLDKERQKNEAAEKELKEAADQVEKSEKAIKENDNQQAAEQLKQAGEKLDGAQGQREQQQLDDKQQRVEKAKEAMQKPDKGGVGAGPRSEEKDNGTGSQHVQVKGPRDSGGKSEVVDLGPNGGRNNRDKLKTPADIDRQIPDRPPETISAEGKQSKISRDAADMTKGYFENLGNQKNDKK